MPRGTMQVIGELSLSPFAYLSLSFTDALSIRERHTQRTEEQKMSAVGGGAHSLHNVFVYGSLMADDVVRALLKRVPLSSPAILNDLSVVSLSILLAIFVIILVKPELLIHRYSIRERVYPAIVPLESKKVSGRVLMGITGPELYILDVFEDVEYERSTVEVSLMDSSKNVQTHAYVWREKNDPNLYGDWDFEQKVPYSTVSIANYKEWKGVHLDDFVKMTMEFMEELELPESRSRVAAYESFFKQDGEK
ncbi:hypothetical protein FNV43_RR11656 [Rhamnella rubrinervis]|uniref:Putative gamma-glutamylcyclotransferase n=1 Tax=Rhamnella rubrinervis TaxID=2594499 RepID=A0A8K0H5X5_9ROSA|nr:hypothetical protein FNV43_RR11656 [Rhamnella rubrinervis]